MSFWRCQDPEDETALHEVALALVAGPRHLQAVSLVWLSEVQLWEAGFALQDSPGNTPVADLKNRHVDVLDLNAELFVRLAGLLQESFQDGNHRTINENRLRHLLLTAIHEDRLPVSELAPPLLTKLLGRMEGEFRQQAEQVYLESGLTARLKSFREAAAWYGLDDVEKSQLGDLQSEVKTQLKESNRPEAALTALTSCERFRRRARTPAPSLPCWKTV